MQKWLILLQFVLMLKATLYLIKSFCDWWDVNLPPHCCSTASLVHIILLDVCSSRVKRLLPVENHRMAVTVQ